MPPTPDNVNALPNDQVIRDALLCHEAFHTHTNGLLILDADFNILLHNAPFTKIWEKLGVPIVKSLSLLENLEAAAALGAENNAAQILLDTIELHGKFPQTHLSYFPCGTYFEFFACYSAKGLYEISVRDVTENERRKAEIAQSEHRYRLLVENITEGLLVLDQQNCIAYANPRFLNIYGGTEADILGTSLTSMIPESARGQVAKILTNDAEDTTTDVPLQCHDGSIRFVLISAAPLTNPNGEPSGNFATITDVTALRRSSELQKQSEIRFRNIIENAPIGILTLDMNGQILSANPTFCNMIDSRTHAIALSAAQQWLPDMSPSLSELMVQLDDKIQNAENLTEQGPTVTATSRMLTRSPGTDQPPGHARLVLSKIGDIGESYLMVVEDITDRHTMEKALQHASKLALLGEMSASMAHEISQPLNIIRLAAENALPLIPNQEDTEHQPCGTMRRTLNTISDQSNRLRDTIDHMQAFSRRDTGPNRSFDVFKTLEDALSMLNPRCTALGINVTQYLPDMNPECPITVMGQPRHMEQVLLNLIQNATDAIVERRLTAPNEIDEILISARLESHFNSSSQTTEELLVIDVSDSGTGIRPEDLPLLFDPFFTRKQESSGTGLGLSISLGLMVNMGGNITAENRPEGGCRFRVSVPTTTIPMSEEEDLPSPIIQPLAKPEMRGCPSLTILLVDDEDLVLEHMENFLERAGHKVLKAEGGHDAQMQLQAMHVDVIITDLQMPNGNGYDLIEHVTAEYPHLTVIVTTGQPLRDRMAMAELETGADAILHKPISLQELTKTLHALC